MLKVPLLDLKRQYASIKDEVLKVTEEVFESQYFILGPRVNDLEKEIAGYQVISDLLDVFIRAVNHTHENKASNFDKLILMLLPDRYKQINEDLYKRLLGICNLIANFSDGYAILLHKKIKGIDLS